LAHVFQGVDADVILGVPKSESVTVMASIRGNITTSREMAVTFNALVLRRHAITILGFPLSWRTEATLLAITRAGVWFYIFITFPDIASRATGFILFSSRAARDRTLKFWHASSIIRFPQSLGTKAALNATAVTECWFWFSAFQIGARGTTIAVDLISRA
jgi:hypothetical protein